MVAVKTYDYFFDFKTQVMMVEMYDILLHQTDGHRARQSFASCHQKYENNLISFRQNILLWIARTVSYYRQSDR